MKSLKIILMLLALSVSGALRASAPDEGMWLPLLLKDYNYEEMKRLGCTLTPEQIYSVNNSSIKDAIVMLGSFCTAEVISDEGLLLTNHHCGYDAIASLSSEESDFLTDGFWAATKKDELPIEGLSVSFLQRMEDVTERVMNKVGDAEGEEAELIIMEIMASIEAEATEDGSYRAEVKAMFEGNAYYLFVYEVYTDIRLVGAPPSSVGKFGGDTDNWMWPRHTGDFSMMRIYCGSDNRPAAYSESNVPYKAKHSLPISLKGMKENDFTMILGYPGGTTRYMTAAEVKNAQKNESPIFVKVMTKRLELMKAEMDKSDAIRIGIASNYASLANSCKYYEGQIRGLNKFDLEAQKKKSEESLTEWINATSERKAKYGEVLSGLEEVYTKYAGLSKDIGYVNMAGFGPDFVLYGISAYRLNAMLEAGQTIEDCKSILDALKDGSEEHFASYYAQVDEPVFAAVLDFMQNDMSEERRMDLFASDYYKKKAKGSNVKFASLVFSKSILTDKARMEKFLAKPSLKKLSKDPGIIYLNSLIAMYRSKIMGDQSVMMAAIEPYRKLYMQAIQEKDQSKKFYPDANFTMRVTYGTVKSYDSWEGKRYETFTWGSQILDKYKPGDEEFDVPEKLRKLLEAKDYGQYAVDGKLPVCFLHNTDITGGNSGSPVINGNGELVGVAFDGNWESMTSDLYWQDEYVRTISVDIRYVLFIVDKYAGAQRLIDEMNLIK